MHEHVRALIAILFLASIGFFFAKRITQENVAINEFNRWRNMWIGLTIAGFLSGNFYVYTVIGCFVIFLLSKKTLNKPALFFVLLFALPPVGEAIPGFGIVNYLFTLTHPRFIELVVLLPAAVIISRKNDFGFGKIWTDKFLMMYLLVFIGLELRDTTLTDALRKSFYLFLDVFLPYYVASRGIKDISQMKVAISAFVTSAIVIGIIAIFENLKHWLLYNSLGAALGSTESSTLYLGRAGELRAIASLWHSIVLGYFMTVALGLYFFLSSQISNANIKKLGFLLVILGLIAPLSRGPWVGAGILSVLFLLQGPQAIKRMSILIFSGIITLAGLSMLPGGQKYIDLIPFVGTAEKGNVDYREKLFHNSLIVIGRNPFFGSSTYLQTPEMQEMKQGQGIIDIVNSYLRIALEVGYVGLGLFIAIFLSALLRIRKTMLLYRDKKDAHHILGRSLIATVLSIMIMLAAVSTIGTVSNIYWSILGLGIAYTRFSRALNKQPAIG
ncbi:MAG TPA: O-antigen ligase family protein [Methylophilus sp.]|nr:O-antigen ligase family protein [Methylophilus sp.]HQQ34008.1 O-antigen ligase family protein [Methylophilus sp.]